MFQVLQLISTSPLLAWLGALFLLAAMLAPLVLALAGLNGEQITDVIKATLNFFVNIIGAYRSQNKDSGSK